MTHQQSLYHSGVLKALELEDVAIVMLQDGLLQVSVLQVLHLTAYLILSTMKSKILWK